MRVILWPKVFGLANSELTDGPRVQWDVAAVLKHTRVPFQLVVDEQRSHGGIHRLRAHAAYGPKRQGDDHKSPRHGTEADLTCSRVKSHHILASGALICVVNAAANAQVADSAQTRVRWVSMFVPGSVAEDRARLDQLRGRASGRSWLLRAAATMTQPLEQLGVAPIRFHVCALRLAALLPQADLTWNSRLPFDRNDGGVWAGVGTTVHAIAGARAECGRVRLTIAPELWRAQNRPFPLLAPQQPWLSGFANPFYSGREASADLPLRFGTRPVTNLGPGQSALEVEAPYVTIGAGSQTQWWGPGVHNALVMSNHAAGIPGAYIRTTKPISARWGSVEARWMVGALTESPYFDYNDTNNLRSFSGVVAAYTPPGDSNLTVGFARVVYAATPGLGALSARFLDALGRWGEKANVRYATEGRAAEQMIEFFGRWIFPRDGLEVYGEWARVLLPVSLRSLLVAPQYSQGYTLGTQWLSNTDSAATAWRTNIEFTMVEQPRYTNSEPPAFYVSPVVPQGYTQRGQGIGALVGPGGSGQFIDVDRVRPDWSVGVFGGRIRFNDEQYYRRSTGALIFAHDISLYGGVRGYRRERRFDVAGELVAEKRMNYLFQNRFNGFDEDHTFDIRNVSLRLAVTPR
jgi:hypothetical protein